VTPSDLSLWETGSLLPATWMDEMVAAERSWCDVPTMTSSDLSLRNSAGVRCGVNFFAKIYSVFRGGFMPHVLQISVQYLVAFKNYNYLNLTVHFSK